MVMQTFQELQQLRKELAEIKALAAAHPQLVEELNASRAEVKAAEKRISNFDALAKKATNVFEARLNGIERERNQLLEQVRQKDSSCSVQLCAITALSLCPTQQAMTE